MENENLKEFSAGLEGRDCVPFFKSDKKQIVFEFFYLVFLLVVSCASIFCLQVYGQKLGMLSSDKSLFMALLGGFMGGWVYDAKWFYRVTARGKNNQYGFLWQPHKLYWRVLTPFLAALVSFSTYLLAVSEVIPIYIKNTESSKAAFSICFILGYFSDLVLSRLAAWAEKVIPKVSANE
jgi:hypothetical protein